jgi:hypothetical protein
MKRWAASWRWAASVVLTSGLLLLAGAPVCESDSCPMSGFERARCRAMGLDCCQAKGGAVSHPSPVAPALDAVLAPGGVLAIGSRDWDAAASAALPIAAPAVLQGVGLFTLLAVFRI